MSGKKHQILKITLAILCVFLMFSTVFYDPLTLHADAESKPVYLSDLKIFYGVTLNDSTDYVKEYAENQGFTLFPSNINRGGESVFIGYKTTTNPDDAITDIRTLGMDRDYYLYDYNQLRDYLKNSNAGTAFTMYQASEAFRQYYAAGSPKAKDAMEGLNLFYVDEAKMSLGDYIMAGKADLDLFLDIAIKSSTGVLSAVLNYLNYGIAPYDASGNAENWANALENSALRTRMNGSMTEAERSQIAKKYDDSARDIFSQIQVFTTQVENASARTNYEATGTVDYTITNEDGQNVKNIEDAVEAMDTVEQEDADAIYLSAYEILNQHDYDETTKLGDWFLEVGRTNADAIELTELYPLVDAMGEEQAGLVRTVGIVSAVTNLSENVSNQNMEETFLEIRQAIRDYNGKQTLSLWDNADDNITGSYIAFTSDAIRKNDGNNSIGKKTQFEILDEKLTTVIKWIDIGIGAAMVGAFVLKGAFTLAATGLAYFSGTAACVSMSAVFASMAGFMAAASVFLMWAGIVVLAFTIGWAIGKWISGKITDALPWMGHTQFPSYVFDAVDTPDGMITVKYKAVPGSGQNGDINATEEERWQILCYSKDKAVGSPIMQDSNGTIFKVLYGNSALQNGYDCINFFGERSPANMNAYREKDSTHGTYVSYRTERSIKSEGPVGPKDEGEDTLPGTGEVNYLADIIVMTATSADAARAKITAKEGKYYILDNDLSRATDVHTFIGYSMTTDPSQAITDLRVAPYHGTDNLTFGEISYGYAGHLGSGKEDGDNSLTMADALLKTKDPRAGSPILADGLHPVTKHSDAEPGWEPVTLFCGLPYNFGSSLVKYPFGDGETRPYSGYYTCDSDDWSRTNVYLYYEPTVKYTSGTKYLSGVFAINGYKIEKTLSMMWVQTKANVGQLKSQILSYPKAKLIDDVNLAQSVKPDMGDGHSNLEEYLGYTWTYNPKRAIYDITAFQGDSYQNTLSYSIQKPLGNATAGYVAASTICQQNLDPSIHLAVNRFISPTNAIINDHALLESYDDYENKSSFDDNLVDGYTKTLPKYFDFTMDKSNFLPLGLYVCGAVSGKGPIALSDVIITSQRKDGVVEGGQISYYAPGTTLSGLMYLGDTVFHSIYDIKNPYETEALNIAYPDWYKDGSRKGGSQLYIYIRGAIPSKPKYISSLSVGSYSREQYKGDMVTKKITVEDDEIAQIDSSVNSVALAGAASSCSGEVIPVNLAANKNDAWYHRGGGKLSGSAPSNTPAAYIGVSRTDKASQAITGVLLYQNNDRTAAAKIKIDGAEFYCDSPSSPIIMKGKQYFLYYTRNRGVLTGARVQDIVIDDQVMASGMATAMCGKAGSTTMEGEAGFPNYIHLKFDRENGVYYTGLYIGKGDTVDAAKAGLVSQECFQFIDMDLNVGTEGPKLYLGYSTGSIDMATATQTKIRMAWSEAVWDVIVTKGEPYQAEGLVNEKNGIYYAPVSDIDLNDGTNSTADKLYMYYCCPVLSEEYNDAHGADTVMPDEVFSAPLSKMAFARYDRVPYNSGVTGEEENGSMIIPWEYVLLSDGSAPADFNAGAYSLDASGCSEDNRVTMFQQRYDGSVKPAGQITGGFVENTMEFGEAYIR